MSPARMLQTFPWLETAAAKLSLLISWLITLFLSMFFRLPVYFTVHYIDFLSIVFLSL